MKHTLHHTALLFTSFSTLLCCALPALFVAIGAGATLAGIVSNVPQLIFLSEHKIWLFSFSGAMLLLSGILRYRSRHAPCPVNPAEARACMRLRKGGLVVYSISLGIFTVGVFFAFVAPLFME